LRESKEKLERSPRREEITEVQHKTKAAGSRKRSVGRYEYRKGMICEKGEKGMWEWANLHINKGENSMGGLEKKDQRGGLGNRVGNCDSVRPLEWTGRVSEIKKGWGGTRVPKKGDLKKVGSSRGEFHVQQGLQVWEVLLCGVDMGGPLLTLGEKV